MTYALGSKSRANLQGVHPILASVVHAAIEITAQDFGVHEGLRTLERQKKLVAAGTSKTLASKHLKQSDGFGHAVDLVPFVAGQLRWEWPPLFPIVAAVREAAERQGVADRIRWGGTWALLSTLPRDPSGIKAAVNAYTDARRKLGKSAFLDGPHYELLL